MEYRCEGCGETFWGVQIMAHPTRNGRCHWRTVRLDMGSGESEQKVLCGPCVNQKLEPNMKARMVAEYMVARARITDART